jgi:hypothetical protein
MTVDQTPYSDANARVHAPSTHKSNVLIDGACRKFQRNARSAVTEL